MKTQTKFPKFRTDYSRSDRRRTQATTRRAARRAKANTGKG